jgi:hypothetical protein
VLFEGVMESPFLVLKLHRQHLLPETLHTLSAISSRAPEELRKQLRVHFIGEEVHFFFYRSPSFFTFPAVPSALLVLGSTSPRARMMRLGRGRKSDCNAS